MVTTELTVLRDVSVSGASGPALLVSYAASSVGPARQALAEDLRRRGFGDLAVEDATLVVSEMLSNALKHARPLPDCGQVRLSWAVQTDETGIRSVLLLVSDGGGTTRPIVLASGRSDTGGRGMGIVEALADDWGCRTEGAATTVWARVRDRAKRPALQLLRQ